MIALEWNDTDSDTNFPFAFSTAIDYLPVSFVTDNLFENGIINSPRYITGLSISEDLGSDSYSTFGFSGSYIPYIRMNVKQSVVNNNEVELSASSLNVFPNPVKDQLNLSINLDQVSDHTTVEVYNTLGALIFN